RAAPVEQHHVARRAGKHVVAGPPERARLARLAAPWQTRVHASAPITDDEERPYSRKVAGRGELGLVEDDARGGEQLARRARRPDRGPVEERDLAVGMHHAREEVGHPLDALPR